MLRILPALGAALLSCLPAAPTTAQAPARPNVIVIVPDDQGWTDAAVQGSGYYQTPGIDRLAASGMRFTRGYSASPLCSPTRLSILTGKYPHRLGMTAPHGHLAPLPADTPLYAKSGPANVPYLVPESARFLPNDADTFGPAFKNAGYATAFMGKWHLGRGPYIPERHGFDVVVGGRGNPGPPGGYFAPWRSDTLPDRPAGTHIDDAITDEALAFMAKSHAAGQPFLLNLWLYSVHGPFQGKPELIEKYRGRTDPTGRHNQPVMGAMIETMDDNVGRVLDQLEALGIADNTVIVYWSDNGGNMYNEVEGKTPTNNAPLSYGKGNIHEGGIRVPVIVRWPGVTEPGAVSDALVNSIDIYPTLLAMTGIEKPATALFDGESLEPALRGGELERDTTFFHFPHSPPKPRSISSSAVIRGDHKLIRQYRPNGDAPYTYELYHLGEDIGEERNLADQEPGLVAELDALIAGHLEATGTPVPPRNPAYRAPAAQQSSAPTAPATGDWSPSPRASLEPRPGVLALVGTSNDPYLVTENLPTASGPVQVVLRLRALDGADGDGLVHWTHGGRGAFRTNKLPFEVPTDGRFAEAVVQLPDGPALKALRIDPARSPGVTELDFVELRSADGTVLKAWHFGGEPAAN